MPVGIATERLQETRVRLSPPVMLAAFVGYFLCGRCSTQIRMPTRMPITKKPQKIKNCRKECQPSAL